MSSPRYHTLPSRSWANQSAVCSTSSPSRVSVSVTTVAVIPMTSRVWLVTTTSLRSPPSASYTHRLPGVNGSQGLSILSTNVEGSGRTV